MEKLMRSWGIAIIAVFLAVLGIIGNLIFDPSLVFILGLLTGAVLIVILNVVYIYMFQKDHDETEEDDLF